LIDLNQLTKIPFISSIKYFESTTSTNSIALQNITSDEFTIFIAETQSAGRGRNNRKWVSPPSSNLYFSFILKPTLNPSLFSPIPLLVAVSVLEVVKRYIPKNIYVKWPNDIWVEDRKISGTLIEISNNSIVVGIGINVNIKDFPQIEGNQPTSFFIETNKIHNRTEILKDFFHNFHKCYSIYLKSGILPPESMAVLNNNLKFKNQEVEVIFNGSSKRGRVEGIGADGALLLDTGKILAGDVVSVRSF